MLFCFFQMWTSALWVRATAAASPPATTRRARTSANAKTATGGWATTANVSIENNNNNKKALAPDAHLCKEGTGASHFSVFFSKKKKQESQREGGSGVCGEIPFFVTAVSHFLNHPAPLLRVPRLSPDSHFLTSGHFNKPERGVIIKCEIFLFPGPFAFWHTVH